MQDKHLFEYAVIRWVPRVEREEFLNVGIILFCASQHFLKTLYQLPGARLSAFYPDVDVEEIEKRLLAFEKVCIGKKYGGPIGQLSMASRFRWLTATRSTVLQVSKVHGGFCEDAHGELQRLFGLLVETGN